MATFENPIKVLYVHHRGDLGGAPTSLLHLIKGLDRRRFQPIVQCPPGPVVELFRGEGVDVRIAPVSLFTHLIDATYHGFRWLMLGRELARLPLHLKMLKTVIRTENISIVHLNESNLVPAAWMAKQMGVKVVWHVRHFLGEGIRRKFLHNCMNRFADCVITIDQDVKLCLGGVERLVVINNSIDLDKYHPTLKNGHRIRAEYGVSSDELCVGLVGNIHVAKGTFDFIRAARIVKNHCKRVKFFLVGGGGFSQEFFNSIQGRLMQALKLRENYVKQAEILIEEEGLFDDFILTRFRSDIVDIYSALDVVVFPSHLRGIGRPGFEAAACGRPVVATTTTFNSEIVVHGVTGLLVPPKNPPKLAEAIIRLLKDRNLREKMGEAGLLHAKENFDYRKNARRVMDIYEAILAEKKNFGRYR